MSDMQDSESSGYSTCSDFGSVDERFKIPPASVRNGTKRRAVEKVEELDEMLKESLVLSPEKRLRLNTPNDKNVPKRLEDPRDALKNGRPPTRRSTSQDIEKSPRVRALRLQNHSPFGTDSISPKLIGQYGLKSPKKRHAENGSIYSKHRLGATFSPLVAGARRKVATPHADRAKLNRQSPLDSPRKGCLRSRGTPRAKVLLNDRFNMLD